MSYRCAKSIGKLIFREIIILKNFLFRWNTWGLVKYSDSQFFKCAFQYYFCYSPLIWASTLKHTQVLFKFKLTWSHIIYISSPKHFQIGHKLPENRQVLVPFHTTKCKVTLTSREVSCQPGTCTGLTAPKTDWGEARALSKAGACKQQEEGNPMEAEAAHMQLLHVHGMLVKSFDSSSSGFPRVNTRICKILRSLNKNTQHAITFHLLTISNGVLLPI